MVRPWNEWLIVRGYDISQPSPEVDTEKATEIARNLLGMPYPGHRDHRDQSVRQHRDVRDPPAEAVGVRAAAAVHWHPPSNGPGSNTSIQDSYNLAWKLSAVLKHQAGRELLETYSAERAPVAEQIVTRANESSREFGQFFEMLGLMEAETEEEMKQQIEERKANTPRPRQARSPGRGDGTQGLRVQRPLGRPRSVL